MEESPGVALKLANAIEDLEIVGGVLAGVAEAAGLDALERNNLQTAVLEACKNVVWHAYEGVRGPLELEARLGAGLVEAVVRDHGIGIRPHLGERTLPHTGIGMPIAHLLARRIIYTNVPGGGTEVRMEFSMPAVAGGGPQLDAAALQLLAQDEREDSIWLALAGGPLARAVLSSALAAMASRAGMGPAAVAEMKQLALATMDAVGHGEGNGRCALRARLAPGGLDLAFSELDKLLEQELTQRARLLGGDGALVLAEDAHGPEPGEGTVLRLRAGA